MIRCRRQPKMILSTVQGATRGDRGAVAQAAVALIDHGHRADHAPPHSRPPKNACGGRYDIGQVRAGTG